MFQNLSNAHKGIALGLMGYTSFAFADICVKWLTQSYSVFQVVSFNSVFSLLICAAFIPLLGRPHSLLRKDHLPFNIARGVLNILISITIVFSFSILPLAEVYTIIFSKPFFAALLAMVFLSQKISLSRGIIMVIGFCGVIVSTQPGAGIDPRMLIPLAATLLIAVMFLLSRKVQDTDLFTIAFYPFIATAMLNIMALNGGFVWPELSHLPIFAIAGALAAIGMICVTVAFMKADAALVSPFVYTEMIWALLFGYLIFGDYPNFWMLAGAAIIIACGLALILTERKQS